MTIYSQEGVLLKGSWTNFPWSYRLPAQLEFNFSKSIELAVSNLKFVMSLGIWQTPHFVHKTLHLFKGRPALQLELNLKISEETSLKWGWEFPSTLLQNFQKWKYFISEHESEIYLLCNSCFHINNYKIKCIENDI